jgi:hypothetical protein
MSFSVLIVKIETNRNFSNMTCPCMHYQPYATTLNIQEAIYSPVTEADLFVFWWYATNVCHECVECRFAVLLLPVGNPSKDLSQMNIQSEPLRKESTCQISSPYAKPFDMTKSLYNYDEKGMEKKIEKINRKNSKNIMVAARLSRASIKSLNTLISNQ